MGRTSNARQRITAVALEQFWSNSSLAVSVDALCRGAGVNKGSFYHFFPSKSDVIIAALDEAWAQTRMHVLEPAFDPDLRPLDRIRRVLKIAYERQKLSKQQSGSVPGCIFCGIGSEQSVIDPAVRRHVWEISQRHHQYFRLALEEAVAAGQFDGDPDLIADAIHNFICGTVVQARIADDPEVINRASVALDRLLA